MSLSAQFPVGEEAGVGLLAHRHCVPMGGGIAHAVMEPGANVEFVDGDGPAPGGGRCGGGVPANRHPAIGRISPR